MDQRSAATHGYVGANEDLDAEVRRLAARDQDPTPIADRQASPFTGSVDRIASLRKAVDVQQKTHVVNLPDLSRAYRADVSVTLIDVSVQELMASGLLPGPSRRAVQAMIKKSEELTAEEQKKINMESLMRSVIKDEYQGDAVEVYGGVMAMIRAFSVLGVKEFLFDGEPNEPKIILTMDRNDPRRHSLYVGDLTDADVNAIGTAVFANIEGDASGAAPFPASGNTPNVVSTISRLRGETFNPSDV